MTDINLLPWRELKREQEKKLFNSMVLLGLVVAAAIVVIMNYYVTRLVENQTERNHMLQVEIDKLDKQIEAIKELKKIRSALISRMNVVQNLQSTRILTVHLFDEMVNIIPNGIYLTKMERTGDIVTVYGYSSSNTDVSEMMRNIEKDQWITNPALTIIQKEDEQGNSPKSSRVSKVDKNSQFQLSFILKHKDSAVDLLKGSK